MWRIAVEIVIDPARFVTTADLAGVTTLADYAEAAAAIVAAALEAGLHERLEHREGAQVAFDRTRQLAPFRITSASPIEVAGFLVWRDQGSLA